MHSANIKENAIAIYNDSAHKFGAHTLASVHWDDEQKALYRYHLIAKHIPNESNVSVLDIGCGNGGLLRHLNYSGFRGTYNGYDINALLIDCAKELYPKYSERFSVVDILNDTLDDTFDYVVLSGLFNSNYGQDFQWICSFIEKMYALANKKVIFNAISTYTNFKEETMFYINPFEISDFIIQNLSREIIVEHGQLPYNFQISITKEAAWKSLNA
ncbi:bifunctional 2-polyprenyl-6-hydroxyphenol methylase/3-demethylubiquinol 3-O-methyltransferase UbiG [Sulfurospirillum sp. hDNRA2]|nr:class I SAM-dependent methyltransferase [Sulfurospirillum sp. DNRA8]MCP3653007.1 methyltransferase domain-containing protein [Sulfurospirillum sp. DNRA8]MCR1811858.1 methyltransferase domain-containing protein [Sulfurospirillum sp. DNRA8]